MRYVTQYHKPRDSPCVVALRYRLNNTVSTPFTKNIHVQHLHVILECIVTYAITF